VIRLFDFLYVFYKYCLSSVEYNFGTLLRLSVVSTKVLDCIIVIDDVH